MLKNYLKTALRLMFRQKAYSAINIIGLSLGIAATLLIVLYVVDELSYDRFHAGAERMYRITFTGRMADSEFKMAESAAPVGPAVAAEIPEVESVTRMGLWRSTPVAYHDKSFTEAVAVADANFFTFFSFRFTAGDPNTALQGLNRVVLTESAARRYFGTENPLGKTLLTGNDKAATEVTGVVQDPPANSHIQFDLVLSGESWPYLRDAAWTNNNLYTYFKTIPGASLTTLQAKLNVLAEKNMGRELEKLLGVTLKQFREQGNDIGLVIQPLLDIHLHSQLDGDITPSGDLQYVYMFSVIAAFILLIACVNFMNLSTARSANRAKEVGVRKSIGAVRSRLVSQFLAESLLYAFCATLLALLIINLAIIPFNTLAGKHISLSALGNPFAVAGLVLFAIFVGILAGSYPALYLTTFKPSDVLKGRIRAGFRNSGLRNGLVTFQFVISIVLMLGSVVVYHQLTYMQQKNMGFDKENVVDLMHIWSLGKNAGAFKQALATHPEFKGASYASGLPPHLNSNITFRKGGSEQDVLLNLSYADHDLAQVMGYQLVQGRFFSPDFASDTAAIVINEAAYKLLGLKSLEHETIVNYNDGPPKPLQIIGVVKDFNFESLRNSVRPACFLLRNGLNNEMAIRLAPGKTQAGIALLEGLWKKYSATSFEYAFIDQQFDSLFHAERRISQIILVFTMLTIFIACLGLFGLATYTAEQRAKEISIRKVMGATIPQVIILLLRDFMTLIAIAFVIAAPLGWYLCHQWLQDFAYRIAVSPAMVLLSGTAALAVALVTISVQAIRAARENPVRAMRGE